MRNIVIMGYLYRVTETTWKRFLKAKFSDSEVERSNAVCYLGLDNGRVYQVTDMDAEEARELYEQTMKQKPRRNK